MSQFTFKQFHTFVSMDAEPTDEQIHEIFGAFASSKKMDDVKAARKELSPAEKAERARKDAVMKKAAAASRGQEEPEDKVKKPQGPQGSGTARAQQARERGMEYSWAHESTSKKGDQLTEEESLSSAEFKKGLHKVVQAFEESSALPRFRDWASDLPRNPTVRDFVELAEKYWDAFINDLSDVNGSLDDKAADWIIKHDKGAAIAAIATDLEEQYEFEFGEGPSGGTVHEAKKRVETARLKRGSIVERDREGYVSDGIMSDKDFDALLAATKRGEKVVLKDIAVDVGDKEDNYYILKLENGMVIDHVHGSNLIF